MFGIMYINTVTVDTKIQQTIDSLKRDIFLCAANLIANVMSQPHGAQITTI